MLTCTGTTRASKQFHLVCTITLLYGKASGLVRHVTFITFITARYIVALLSMILSRGTGTPELWQADLTASLRGMDKEGECISQENTSQYDCTRVLHSVG